MSIAENDALQFQTCRTTTMLESWAGMDEERKKEFWATLALRHCKNLGARSRIRLLNTFGSAYQAVQNKNIWQKTGLLSHHQANHLLDESGRSGAQAEWDKAKKLNDKILLWSSSYYPERLRELPDAPILLYCRGDITLLASPALAIVGSRRATKHGQEVADHMATHLAACGLTIISGMAEGIDSTVHEAALRQIGKSIGVLGTGIDKIYPRNNEILFTQMAQEGLLLSEFPPGTPPFAANFPIRNRIISALSLGVLVIEASSRSGSLITARLALEQNREVFAVPGPALNTHCSGCQELIRQGVHAVFCAEDILRDLSDQLKPFTINEATLHIERSQNLQGEVKPPLKKLQPHHKEKKDVVPPDKGRPTTGISNLTEPEQRLLTCLNSKGEMHPDTLASILHLSVTDLSSLLVSLEIAGLIKRLPGARYKIIENGVVSPE